MRNQNDDVSLSSWTVPSTIETESYVNLEDDEHVLKLTVTPRNELIGCHSKERTTKVCVNIKACDLPEGDEDRPPVDIVVALDTSGSMAGSKLTDCKRTLDLMLRHLSSKDRFGLVSYGSRVHLVFPACFMTPANKEKALGRVREVVTDGCTNLSGGLALAAQEIQMIDKPNIIRSIFLLTDGMANMGIADTPSLVSMVHSINQTGGAPSELADQMNLDDGGKATLGTDSKPMATVPSRAPISLFCFGYGTHHNSDMLQSIASASPGGAYYFVEKDSDVSSAFGDAMGGLLSVVAQSSVVTLSVSPQAAEKGIKILDVYHDEKIKRDNGSFTVNVGDFYAEESRDILVELQLSEAMERKPVPHLNVTASYMDTIHHKSVMLGPVECCIARPPDDHISPTNPHVETQLLRVLTVREIQAADREARSNNLSAAQERIRSHQNVVQQSPFHSTVVGMALADDMETIMDGFSSSAAYRSVGSHWAKNKAMAHGKQRGMVSAPEQDTRATLPYASTNKMRMKRAFATMPGTHPKISATKNPKMSQDTLAMSPKRQLGQRETAV